MLEVCRVTFSGFESFLCLEDEGLVWLLRSVELSFVWTLLRLLGPSLYTVLKQSVTSTCPIIWYPFWPLTLFISYLQTSSSLEFRAIQNRWKRRLDWLSLYIWCKYWNVDFNHLIHTPGGKKEAERILILSINLLQRTSLKTTPRRNVIYLHSRV